MSEDWHRLPRDRFGDTPELQDALVRLVIAGKKTATCMAAGTAPPPVIGGLTVIEDGAGQPVCIIETLSLQSIRFCDVDAAMAAAEGEGDLSLDYWRTEHIAYFSRNGGFAEDMWLLFETFRLVRVL